MIRWLRRDLLTLGGPGGVRRSMSVLPLTLAVGGCFLAPWSPDRPDPAAVSGAAVYREGCDRCHAAQTNGRHAPDTHIAKGIRCGQCHRGANHPDFTEPVADARCGGCHQAEYQQTLASKHFASRVQLRLDTDRAARVDLRRAGITVGTDRGRRFAGDVDSGDLGGRLCAACHYDEHRLGPDAVKREPACTGCHADRDAHYASGANGVNRCVDCHVRIGQTATGQIVNSHRFAMPGTEAER
jgi:hypothetical protein